MLKRALAAGGIAAAAAAVAIWTLPADGGPRAPAPAGANLWVDANGGSCARQSSAGAYVDGQACSSISDAYNVAQAGDRIYVRAGSYGPQSVPARSLGTSAVTFAKAPGGGSVVFDSLSNQASYVVFDGFTVTRGITVDVTNSACESNQCSFDTHDVVVRNFHTSYANIRASRVTLEHGEVGPYSVCAGLAAGGTEDGILIGGLGRLGGPFTPADHVTIDDVAVHDILWNGSCGGPHTDAIQSFSSRYLTIKNSRIWNAETSLLTAYSFDDADSSQIDHMLIQNNQFGSVPQLGHGLSIGSPNHNCGSRNIILQNNTFWGNAGADITCGSGPKFRNNVVFNDTCANYASNREWDYDYNVFAGSAGSDTICPGTPHAKVCTPVFLDPAHANGNGDIVANDPCVKSAADPSSYPRTDIHGDLRWASDTGATAVTQRPSEMKLLARRTKTKDCRVRGPLPDRRCSPGAIYADATLSIVCAPGYASRALNLSEKTKAAIYAQYGIPRRHYGRPYQVDHIVPLELGGSNDSANLFPEAGSNPSPGFGVKNALEHRLQELVCSGQRKLGATQRAIARDWVALYRQVFGTAPQ